MSHLFQQNFILCERIRWLNSNPMNDENDAASFFSRTSFIYLYLEFHQNFGINYSSRAFPKELFWALLPTSSTPTHYLQLLDVTTFVETLMSVNFLMTLDATSPSAFSLVQLSRSPPVTNFRDLSRLLTTGSRATGWWRTLVKPVFSTPLLLSAGIWSSVSHFWLATSWLNHLTPSFTWVSSSTVIFVSPSTFLLFEGSAFSNYTASAALDTILLMILPRSLFMPWFCRDLTIATHFLLAFSTKTSIAFK